MRILESRRGFLKVSGLAGVAAGSFAGAAPAYIPNLRQDSPNQRVRFASIGVGGKGRSDTEDAASHGELVAICDIDEGTLNSMGEKAPQAKKYFDFRTMLAEMGDKIDAVTVSTPDHTHAPASVMAMRMGKHCFCQKPLTWSIEEARLMRELAAKQNLCTQMGNQGTASDGLRASVELLRTGVLGGINEIHVWTNRPIWPQGLERPKDTPPVPNNLHWFEFLGAAPDRPYHPAYHSFKWRGWLDFGTGALGDMACHEINMPAMALELFDPESAEVLATSGIVGGETYPVWSVVRLNFGARGSRGPLSLYWYEGGKNLPEEQRAFKKHLAPDAKEPEGGLIILGQEGKFIEGAGLTPREKFAGRGTPDQTLPRSPGHFTEFVEAIKAGKPSMALSNFDYAGRLAETVLLGVLAQKVGKKVQWDAANMKAVNCPEADPFIRRVYRPGFSIHV